MAYFIIIEQNKQPSSSAQIDIIKYLKKYNQITLANHDLEIHINGIINYVQKKIFGSASKRDKTLNVSKNLKDEEIKYIEINALVNIKLYKIRQ